MENTKISPNFLVQKFCANVHFSQGFWRLVQVSLETMRFSKVSIPENLVKLRYSMQ